ncbi:hypothetical protein MLP_11900 [Microlunatus phosphovorus NM-1]|uniref:MucB/RseB N-terminal domain-containing protein n=1 Tax=Microlunatus phosphovorus (strain ATCC 700054 / DSM 10555 / JCM 9379 / NBRC 101784 / NCIMB 13414 / VKM Ac-1990 / NM-1) TaxID=1032480 RepID=F5XNU0_MICPN|nr:hypothetical protein [Microlunatus phosphovorus]BAK34204.1 hypothetical protein MLP_11900 [Microlunatus phosphovorus NM-1]
MPTRPWLRWLVPLAALFTVIATVLVAGNASADEKLPPRSAEQLLVDLQQAQVDGFSGTVEQSADLGIPALPGVSEHGSDFSSLISGSHTLRVAYAAPDSAKVSLLGELSESSVIRHGTDVWTWSSKENAATHTTVDKHDESSDPEDLPTDAPKTPQEAAQRILTAVGSSTDVSVATDTKVAGRAAYELVLKPKDSRSLISSVRIAVDGAEHVATRVQVYAGAATAPVAEIGFSEVDFSTPPVSTFEFSPPKGAKVTELTPQSQKKDGTHKLGTGKDGESSDETRPAVVGEGWTSVVVAKLPDERQSADSAPSDRTRGRDQGQAELQAYLNQLPKVSGSWGSGRLLAGKAFSLVITDDGRVAVGAVAPELLYAALG